MTKKYIDRFELTVKDIIENCIDGCIRIIDEKNNFIEGEVGHQDLTWNDLDEMQLLNKKIVNIDVNNSMICCKIDSHVDDTKISTKKINRFKKYINSLYKEHLKIIKIKDISYNCIKISYMVERKIFLKSIIRTDEDIKKMIDNFINEVDFEMREVSANIESYIERLNNVADTFLDDTSI